MKRLKTIRAGVARMDITPKHGTPLAGACWLRPAREICDRLSAKTLVLEQGNKRVAIITADVCGFDAGMVKRLREYGHRSHGVMFLMCNASHTHSGPDTYNEFSDYTDRHALAKRRRYQAAFEKQLRSLM